MKKSFVIYLSLILFLTTSCSKKDTHTIPVNIEAKKDDIGFYDIFESVEIVPMETNKDFLIQQITKKIFFDNTYYIFDKQQKAVFAINQSGKVKLMIKQLGKGPGEYTNIVDFEINNFTNSLDILTPFGEVLKYDLNNGVYISSYNLPESIKAVHFFKSISKDTVVFYQSFEKNKVLIYSINEKQILNEQHAIPDFVHRHLPGAFNASPFHVIEGKLHLFEFFSNTIHVFEQGKLYPKFSWDFGKYNFDINKLESGKEGHYYSKYLSENKNLIYLFATYIENNSLILTQFKFRESFYTLIYFKKNNEYLVIDKFKEGHYFPLYPDLNENDLFAVVHPWNLKHFVPKEMMNIQGINIDIRDEDNPVIIKYIFADKMK